MGTLSFVRQPEKKGKGEKFAEWLPVAGTYITGKDAVWYYKEGKYLAGSIMTVATAISLATDVAMFFGAVPAKAVGVTVEKGAAKAAGAVARIDAEMAVKMSGKAADRDIARLLVDKLGKVTDDELTKAATDGAKRGWTTAEKLAGKELGKETAEEEVEKAVAREIGKPKITVTKHKIDEVIKNAVERGKEVRATLSSSYGKKYVGEAINAAKAAGKSPVEAVKEARKEVIKAAKVVIEGGAVKETKEAAGKGLTATLSRAKRVQEYLRKTSLFPKVLRRTKADIATQKSELMKNIMRVADYSFFAPAVPLEGARMLVSEGWKGGRIIPWIVKKVAKQPIPAASGVFARKVGEWIAAPIARKTKVKKGEAKKEVKGVKVSEVGLLAYVKATKYIKESVPLEYQQLAKSEALLKKIAPGKEWKEIKSFIDKVVLDKYAEDNVIPNITVREEGGETHESREWAKKCVKADRPLDKYTLKDQIAYFDSVFAARPDIRKKMK